jgi:hypothetical protein
MKEILMRGVRFSGGKPLENPIGAKTIADATARLIDTSVRDACDDMAGRSKTQASI